MFWCLSFGKAASPVVDAQDLAPWGSCLWRPRPDHDPFTCKANMESEFLLPCKIRPASSARVRIHWIIFSCDNNCLVLFVIINNVFLCFLFSSILHTYKGWNRARATEWGYTHTHTGYRCFTLQGSVWFPCRLLLVLLTADVTFWSQSSRPGQSSRRSATPTRGRAKYGESRVVLIQIHAAYTQSDAQNHVWMGKWILIVRAWNLQAIIDKNSQQRPHILEKVSYMTLICSLILDN